MNQDLQLSKANRRPSREALVRKHTERPQGWVPPNAMAQVSPEALGPNVVIRWIRQYFTKSEQDPGSIFKRMQRGWTPVKPEEIPSLASLSDPQGFIAQNGCILCKNDKQVAQYDVEYFEDQAIGALNGAASEFLGDNHDAMPKFSKSQKNTFRRREPGI